MSINDSGSNPNIEQTNIQRQLKLTTSEHLNSFPELDVRVQQQSQLVFKKNALVGIGIVASVIGSSLSITAGIGFFVTGAITLTTATILAYTGVGFFLIALVGLIFAVVNQRKMKASNLETKQSFANPIDLKESSIAYDSEVLKAFLSEPSSISGSGQGRLKELKEAISVDITRSRSMNLLNNIDITAGVIRVQFEGLNEGQLKGLEVNIESELMACLDQNEGEGLESQKQALKSKIREMKVIFQQYVPTLNWDKFVEAFDEKMGKDDFKTIEELKNFCNITGDNSLKSMLAGNFIDSYVGAIKDAINEGTDEEKLTKAIYFTYLLFSQTANNFIGNNIAAMTKDQQDLSKDMQMQFSGASFNRTLTIDDNKNITMDIEQQNTDDRFNLNAKQRGAGENVTVGNVDKIRCKVKIELPDSGMGRIRPNKVVVEEFNARYIPIFN